jgi:hypothetical protein
MRDDEADAEDFRAVGMLAEALTDVVGLLTERRSRSLTAEAIIAFAHQCMPRTQHTGLLLSGGDKVHTVAATSDVPGRLDELRTRLGEGPAFDVLDTNDYVVADDLADDPRWPRYGEQVVQDLDLRSVACFRLHLGGQRRAALMFLSEWPYAFDETGVAVGAICAAYCSLVLLTENLLGEQVSHRRAAEVHREIGVAAGILLADQNLTVEEAFGRLHRASRQMSASMSETARHVIEHRALRGDRQ